MIKYFHLTECLFDANAEKKKYSLGYSVQKSAKEQNDEIIKTNRQT
jgi:hypothetical protein